MYNVQSTKYRISTIVEKACPDAIGAFHEQQEILNIIKIGPIEILFVPTNDIFLKYPLASLSDEAGSGNGNPAK